MSPQEAASLFVPFDFVWWVAGGWAIDAFLGEQTRPHSDTDIGLFRGDQLAIQAALNGWDLQCADPPGTLRVWRAGESLDRDVHDIWCRRAPGDAWRIQLQLNEHAGSRWLYRRLHSVSRPLDQLTFSRQGIRYLLPEVQLLFKAQGVRPKDEADFAAARPRLTETARAWLREAIETAHGPGHPWIPRLRD